MVVPSCLLGLFGMSIATVRAWPTEMPVWGLVLLLSALSYFITRCYHLCKTNIAVGFKRCDRVHRWFCTRCVL